MLQLSEEQQAIVEAALHPQCVIACAGSGKTTTAVRRLHHVQEAVQGRKRVALLSYSNVAVDTFRREYATLAKAQSAREAVIETVDSFITSNLITPHAARFMMSSRSPFLVHGTEPFMGGHKIFTPKYPVPVSDLRVRIDQRRVTFEGRSESGIVTTLERETAIAAIERLGKSGAYTHELARYWALRMLRQESALSKILALRFPYILIDEAQDVGTMHRAILAVLRASGSVISAIGDPNQAIYEFADADGSYLVDLGGDDDVLQQRLTQNWRSVAPIVAVGNAVAKTTNQSMRPTPARKHGAFYFKYEPGNAFGAVTQFTTLAKEIGVRHQDAVILCRGTAMLNELVGGAKELGRGATEQFALSAVHRDRSSDIGRAFSFALNGIIRLLEKPPATLRRDVLAGDADTSVKSLRRLLWVFLSKPDSGLPPSTLPARSKWHVALKQNVGVLLDQIESRTTYQRRETWKSNLTVTELTTTEIAKVVLLGETHPRISTVHQAKGESIDAVMYVVRKPDIRHLLEGPHSEEGRIGYVAITRAKDLLVLAIPENASSEHTKAIERIGFQPL